MSSLSRTVGNPTTGESVTFIKTTDETNGEYLLFRTDLPPNNGIFLHYHTAFVETFEGLTGVLDVTLDEKKIPLKKGDVAVVPKDHTHGFWNNTDQFVSFTAEIRPADTFEAFVRCGYGLDTDGRSYYNPLLKIYLPKNPLLLGTLFELGEFYVPYLPRFLQKGIFGALAALSRWTGAAKTMDKYYKETPQTPKASNLDEPEKFSS
ncbi:cupin domain-containing protein [Brevibacillus fluminis]|uniref:Cupin domain-containing protein n=1 Tax=Brevibacillus fluminis TaxID=511487 RepID=A0A3M8DUU4_9BACL|nr:cupin domain-containing protein [Brevibacillus fluminis]RNB91255.1 cupin domain-containing protein [Brevibacillus fluminis]